MDSRRNLPAISASRGIEAWALTGANQLEFSISMSTPTKELCPGTRMWQWRERISIAFVIACEAVRDLQRASSRKSVGFPNIFARLDDRELPLAVVWLTGRPFAQSDSRPLNVGWAVIYRALLIASGISESDLRAIGRRHNDAGLTAAEAMRARAGIPLAPLVGNRRAFRAPAGGAWPRPQDGDLDRRPQGDARARSGLPRSHSHRRPPHWPQGRLA